MKLVRRIDSALIITLLVTAGLSTIFFWAAWLGSETADEESTTPTVTAFVTATDTSLPSATFTLTFTPSATSTETPTRYPSNTPTPSDTPTSTPTDTATLAPSATLTNTASPTSTATPSVTLTSTAQATLRPTRTSTPPPTPEVNRLDVSDSYAGEPLEITGTAVAESTVTLLDNGEIIAEVQTNAIGAWRVYLEDGLAGGSHRLEVYVTTADGTQSETAPVAFIFSVAPD